MSDAFPRIGEVREQRAGLRTTMQVVEAAAAAPVAGGAEAWRVELDRCLDQLRQAWDRHIAVTEATDGLFARIRVDAPQLVPRIHQLDREHADIQAVLADFASDRRHDVDRVREAVIDLLAKLTRHRQHGADVVYEAYSVDLGGAG